MAVSTSLGSTAHNLSYNGSIVYPSFSSLQITPMAPINSNRYRPLTKSVIIPENVNVEVVGQKVTVKGPKGTLSRTLHKDMTITLEGGVITVTRPSDEKTHRSLHGLTRTLINNMVVGVTEGFKKELEINGVGYRAALQGKDLNLTLGYSHPVVYTPQEGVTIEVPAPNVWI